MPPLKTLCSILGVMALLAAGCAASRPATGTKAGAPAPAAVPAADSTAPTAPTADAGVGPAPAGKDATPAQSTRLRPDALAALLEYIPISLADYHPANMLGPAIHFIDFARMRQDLGLPAVTGASSHQDKLPLIRNLNTQALSAGVDNVVGSGFFAEWGWDFADLDQTLTVPGDNVAILLVILAGRKFAPLLAKKGYVQKRCQEFTLFTAGDKANDQLPAFALKEDTLIVAAGKDKTLAEQLILLRSQRQKKMSAHPMIVQLLPRLDGAWGAVLAPSGDAEAVTEQLHNTLSHLTDGARGTLYEKYKLDDPVAIGWDFMAIRFKGKPGEATTLHYLYHYPSANEAQRDVDLVRQSLTEAPSYSGQGRKWSDLVSLQSVTVEGSFVQATATTRSSGLIGSSLANRDWSFLPLRVGAAAK